ncbi:CAP domain-containing protein [Xylariales sp. PMI_506]|nr:CAP domain-containing protein [Xylariales sp. PMI_506]
MMRNIILAVSTSAFLEGAIATPVDIPQPVVGSGVIAVRDHVVERAATTTSAAPVVTDTAYINTVLRHHNVHRLNHSAPLLTWSSSLAETAKQIASSCVFAHNTTANGGGYGQNIGAGFPANDMGQFITDGMYNGEVNYYTYYGAEPVTSTAGYWAHFSQIVWKKTTAVGCYTYDCSATGVQGVGAGIGPYFSVCNYSPPGNYYGQFTANVGASLNKPSVYETYECPNYLNCDGPTHDAVKVQSRGLPNGNFDTAMLFPPVNLPNVVHVGSDT